MFIRTFCLVASAPQAAAAVESAAARAVRELPGLRQAQVNRVVRHIPTDYIANDLPYKGVVAQADEIGLTLEWHFDDPAAARAAQASPVWEGLLKEVGAAAPVLFSLEAEPHLAVPLTEVGKNGGFRRWLLLKRNAPTQEGFRDAWFGRHASLVRHLPRLEGYVQNLVTARYDANGQPAAYEALPIDGVAEVCYANQAAMDESYASDARLPLRDDGRDLNARVSTVLVEGRVFR